MRKEQLGEKPPSLWSSLANPNLTLSGQSTGLFTYCELWTLENL